jgi:hypothetical protein
MKRIQRALGGSSYEVPGLAKLARAFTTRRVPDCDLVGVDTRPDAPPRSGDLVLCRITDVRHHTRLQRPSGRRKILFPGDLVIAVYGDRYAPRQFEATIPRALGSCHLVAAGGVIAQAHNWHERIVKGPTEVTTLALITNAEGERVNLADYALPKIERPITNAPVVIASLGSSMNSGKTTAAAFLARGLHRGGHRVGFAKATGTGAGNDLWMVQDAGAKPVLDFTDAGYASTYRLATEQVEDIIDLLLDHLTARGVEVAILEIADGLLQPETAAVLESPRFHSRVDAAFFAAPDALAAKAGVDLCASQGLRLLGITGSLTAAPLQQREACAVTRLPAYGRIDLACPVTAWKLCEEARA